MSSERHESDMWNSETCGGLLGTELKLRKSSEQKCYERNTGACRQIPGCAATSINNVTGLDLNMLDYQPSATSTARVKICEYHQNAGVLFQLVTDSG